MDITNDQVKKVQNALNDIIQNINSNMEILNDEELSMYFLHPILTSAVNISDKVFIQSRDTINKIEL